VDAAGRRSFASPGYWYLLSLPLALIVWSGSGLALDDGNRTLEPDLDLSVGEPPVERPEIPQVSFRLQQGEPKIDAELDDPFWQEAQKFDLNIELYPTRLAEAAVPTEAMIGLTSTHVYVAFMAHDPDPSELRSAFKGRDSGRDDDYVALVIDPSGQAAKKLEFRVNPHGTVSDVFQDTVSDRYLYDWDTVWESAARITEFGYQVEMAIPLESLKFTGFESGGDKPGIAMVKRSYPRRVDRIMGYFFQYRLQDASRTDGAPVTPDADPNALGLLAAEPALRDTSEPVDGSKPANRRLRFTPHVIYHADEERDVGGEFKRVDDHNLFSAGFDLKYQPSSRHTLALTMNPNFTEVEEDIARENINNPFIPFKPEKRAFFQEIGEYFATMTRVVYTRNIIDPEVGFSYHNAGQGQSLGAFWVSDRQTEVIIPDNLVNDTVELLERSRSAAFHYQVPRGTQTLGVHGTYRSGSGYHNYLMGLDGLANLGIDDKLRFQVMYSDTQYPESFAADVCETDDCTQAPPPDDCPIGDCSFNASVLRADYTRPLSGHGLRFNYKHDGPESLYWINYYDVAPDFRADLGFVRQVDLRAANLAYGRKWYFNALAGDRGKSRIRLYGIGTHMRSHRSNDPLDTSFSVFGEFRGSYQTLVRLGYFDRERAVNRIDQSSLEVGDNAPLFDENYLQWYFEISPIPNLTINFDGRYGTLADPDNMVAGTMAEFEPRLIFNRGSLEVRAAGEFRDFDVDGGRLYREQFLTFTLIFRPSPKMTHRLFLRDDITRRDPTLWLATEPGKERESWFEYTLFYLVTKGWNLMTGFKLADEYDEVLSMSEVTDREYYLKLVCDFDFRP